MTADRTKNHDLVEEMWENAVKLAMNHVPQRIGEVVATVSKRLIDIKRHAQAAGRGSTRRVTSCKQPQAASYKLMTRLYVTCVMLQECLDGEEWVVDTVSRDGEHKVSCGGAATRAPSACTFTRRPHRQAITLWRYHKGET